MSDAERNDRIGEAEQRPPSCGDEKLDEALRRWMRWDKNEWTRAQTAALLESVSVSELRGRFCSTLSFGTAGLRAPMGAGFNRINDLTVIQSTQGLCVYLLKCVPDAARRGVVVGFDTRGQPESGCSSQRLASLTAAVLLSRDVGVHLFSSYVPTPYVPFAVKELGAAAGVMITASHNPKEDNGYKVYWSNGAQVTAPHDAAIMACVKEHQEPWGAACWDVTLAQSSPLRSDPLKRVDDAYMQTLTSLCWNREANSRCPLKFVHSSFHGVAHDFVRRAFAAFGFDRPPIPVPEQKDPDPQFPTVHVPNPEEGHSVLELSIRLAEQENATVVLATDPDADRLAVAEQTNSREWKVFSGNELAALLSWWMLSAWKHTHGDCADLQDVYMLTTAVSSRILHALARQEGFKVEETLPGFKWIGNRIQELTAVGKTVLFAFEESIGFLCGSLIPEKDGVSTAAVMAEMASFLHERNLSFQQQLHNIYQMYGYHLSRTSYVTCNDTVAIRRIFTRIRDFESSGTYPNTCGGIRVVNVRDVNTGYDSSQTDNRSVLPVSRSGHMVTFMLENGVVATLRTSGTEPKIKIYTELCTVPGTSEVSGLEAELQKVTDALLEDFLEPEKNNLIRRVV
ncbi:glucose 1,6-bisphosphate synthase [Corythoichthys intestinalis]|uniref:glucose 1,6-bisphosphate synthase n=1 Tax=Corythoichthys intestinalis TaxID=161448 RepID=UPI0025A59CD5|nr:glucose 1,6-bisphosphate synthase [Corythoichthys intestinalis]XP_061803340.1 glucose 1,6-bisphosphate synthase-like [Nerophis lumbriciformis]